uniref:Carbohydrate sulfotransferase n=1 Tax=Oryzias latipes TaxID=8090 RepID=A0A3B3HTB4_ORYLA
MCRVSSYIAVHLSIACCIADSLQNSFSFLNEIFISAFAALRSTKKQDLRKDLLRKYCAGVNQSLDDLKDTDLKNFIVDDKHGIIYCYIPKVACTNWKRTLIALNYSEPYPDPTSFEHNWVHDSERFQYLNDFPKAEREAKLKHYTKFLFVRDPFVRLISAYRDKIRSYSRLLRDRAPAITNGKRNGRWRTRDFGSY